MRLNIYLKFLLFLSLHTIFHKLHGQAVYYPDSIWQTKTPAELKMNAQLLDSAINFAIQNETKTEYDLRIANLKAYASEPNYRILGPVKQRGKPAGVILKNGYIAAQWGDTKRVDMTFSVTKSYLSTVAGLALDNRLIKNIDERVKPFIHPGEFSFITAHDHREPGMAEFVIGNAP